MRAKRAHEKRLKRFSHSGWRRTLTISFPDQSGGLEVPLLRGAKAKGWTTYGLPPSLKNIPLEYFLRYARKSRTAAHLEHARLRRILRRALVPLGTRFPLSSGLLCPADRVGMYELRTAGANCPALPVVLGLRCECELYGTAANQVKVLCGQGAQRGSMTCFYGAYLRALVFLLLYYPEFSHRMGISTRLNHTFPICASNYLPGRLQLPYRFRKCPCGAFSGNLVDYKNIPVEYFSARLWLALPTKSENLCSV